MIYIQFKNANLFFGFTIVLSFDLGRDCREFFQGMNVNLFVLSRAIRFWVDFDKRMWYLECNINTKRLLDITLVVVQV